MPREEKVVIYKFLELDDFAKDKVRDNIRKFYPPPDWNQLILNKWKDDLEDKGFDDVEINYSGFWSQGDGASFTGTLNLETFLTKVNSTDIHVSSANCNRILKLLKSNALSISMTVERFNPSYLHSATLTIETETSVIEHKRIRAVIEDMTLGILDLVKRVSNLIYKELETDFEYLTSNEAIDEFIRTVSSDYLADGTVINLKR